MKISGLILLGIFVTGLVIGFFTSSIVGEKELRRAKQFGDSVETHSNARDSALKVFSDSMNKKVAGLEARNRKVIRVAVADSHAVARLDTALSLVETKDDSIRILLIQRDSLKHEVLSLWAAKHISDSTIADLKFHKDSIQTVLDSANVDIKKLNRTIQGLRPRLPKLVRYSFEAIKVGGAFYAGTQYQKHKDDK